MDNYRVEVRSVTYPYLDVEAETPEEALSIAEETDGGAYTPDTYGTWDIDAVYDSKGDVVLDCSPSPAPTFVYVYKEYDDDLAYGEEIIVVRKSKESAKEYLAKRVIEFYKRYTGNSYTFEEIKKNADDDEFVDDEYVSVPNGRGGRVFFSVEEQEVLQ